jgi:hypothetical protein
MCRATARIVAAIEGEPEKLRLDALAYALRYLIDSGRLPDPR